MNEAVYDDPLVLVRPLNTNT